MNKQEFLLMVNQSDSYHGDPHKYYANDFGVSAIDFVYDNYYEKVLDYLLGSASLLKRLKENPEDPDLWNILCTLVNALNREDAHPYYYLIISTIVNLYKRELHDENGQLVDDYYLVRFGLSLQRLREKIVLFLEACAKDGDDERSALKHYLKEQYNKTAIKKVLLELIPESAHAPESQTVTPVIVLHPEMPEDIWNYLIPQYLKANLFFRQCENCHRFYVTTGAGNPKYCDRIVEGTNQTCRFYSAKAKAHVKNTTNPVNVLFNRTYKTMYSRVSSGRLRKKTFQAWAAAARLERDRYESGQCSLENFAQWLEESRTMPEYRH